MPTDTFFRLPEEKRERILAAAREEFSGIKYADVSINRIIHAAEIPRGSFYQYFAGKDDLFRYLIDGFEQYALDGYLEVLEECEGDIFRTALAAFDHVRRQYRTPRLKPLGGIISFLRRNPGLDVQKLLTRNPAWLDPVWERIDTGGLRSGETNYIRTVFHLCLLPLGTAMLDALAHPDRWEVNRAWLAEAIQILQYGCLVPQAAALSQSGRDLL